MFNLIFILLLCYQIITNPSITPCMAKLKNCVLFYGEK